MSIMKMQFALLHLLLLPTFCTASSSSPRPPHENCTDALGGHRHQGEPCLARTGNGAMSHSEYRCLVGTCSRGTTRDGRTWVYLWFACACCVVFIDVFLLHHLKYVLSA
ncbi:uncharacterized protein LOC142574109 [Dermacentor variabilis]|uniref:uncharacterized protein LOC142574109 n=1 Tax=Dermacentor variabilis TaxID=34621 RepID=UPI003F5C924D